MERCARKVLFLRTGNAARSILAEAILNDLSGASFSAFSAGSQPKGKVHPYAVELLIERGHYQSMWRSKSWKECARQDAPRMDFIITVCDNTAGESCPVWPSRPITAHWEMPDSVAEAGSESLCRQAFARAHDQLLSLIQVFAALSTEQIASDRLMLKVDHMGREKPLTG